MKLIKLLILFLFLSLKGFSQQAVLTSSGEKVILNFLSSLGGTVSGTLTVGGASTLTGTLTTKAGISNIGTITNTGSLVNTGNLTVNGNGTITGTLGVTGATTISGTTNIGELLTTSGGITNNGALTNNGNATITGTLGVTGNTTITGTTTLTSINNTGTITNTGALINTGKLIVGASSAASASAVLEASSTTQGFLPPRMTEAQRNAISSAVAGLVVWCSNCGINGELQVHNGTTWTNMIGGTAAVPYTIGQAALGGKIAYILQPSDPGYDANVQHGLVATVADISTGAAWGCMGTTISGADGTVIGTGNQNTIDIMAGCATAGIAARLAGDLVQGGYSDWYLPSQDELNKLYLNRAAIGGFANDYYWSSTEYSNFNAWFQDFNAGSQYNYGKNNPSYVRAIRAF